MEHKKCGKAKFMFQNLTTVYVIGSSCVIKAFDNFIIISFQVIVGENVGCVDH